MEANEALKHFRSIIDQGVHRGFFSTANDVIAYDDAYKSIKKEIGDLRLENIDLRKKVEEYERSKSANTDTK